MKEIRMIFVVLAFGLVFLPTAAAYGQVVYENEYFPMYVGNMWGYDVQAEETREYSHEEYTVAPQERDEAGILIFNVAGIEGSDVDLGFRFSYPAAEPTAAPVTAGFTLYLSQEEDAISQVAIYDPQKSEEPIPLEGTLMPTPLYQEEPWELEVGWVSRNISLPFPVMAEVGEEERVSVPAGTFECVKVSFTPSTKDLEKREPSFEMGEFEGAMWWAEEIGLVKLSIEGDYEVATQAYDPETGEAVDIYYDTAVSVKLSLELRAAKIWEGMGSPSI